MQWGYALVWPYQWEDRHEDPTMVKLLSLKEYGLKHCMGSVGQFAKMDQAQFEMIADTCAKLDVGITLNFHTDYFGDKDAAKRDLEHQLEVFLKIAPSLKAPIATTAVGPYHRFMAEPSLASQMAILEELLAPIAKACAEAGRPLGIENHADYYVSDLVGLCERVPHLGIFLDTGNCFMVGETPIPAFEQAAPHVIGGHFKDHVVRPVSDASPIHFEVGAATLGTGHAPLKECFDILKANTPNVDDIAMQIELIPPSFSGNDNIDSFEQSVEFVFGLEEGR